MILHYGKLIIPEEITQHAESIKHENYKVNKPTREQIRHALTGYTRFNDAFRNLVGLPEFARLDFVYFSCREGAEVHTDEPLKDKFNDWSYIVPIIVPQGAKVLWADHHATCIDVGEVYGFNHSKPHALFLDRKDGCVVVMISEKK